MSGLPSWTIHAASDKRCTARGLGSSGNIAWAITGSSARSKTIVWWFCSSASEIAKKSIASALPEIAMVIQLEKKTLRHGDGGLSNAGDHNRAAASSGDRPLHFLKSLRHDAILSIFQNT